MAVAQWSSFLLYCAVLLLTLLFLWHYAEYQRVIHCSECRETDKIRDGPSLWNEPSSKASKELEKDKATHKRLSISLVVILFLKYSKKSGVNSENIVKREQEYRTVMQRNLNHPQVNRVHVLTTDPEETLAHFNNFTNQEKMLVAKVKSIAWLRDPLEYISLHLIGKDVMYANADIYLGDGFDLVDPEVMSHQNIMYSLTRQISKKERCRHKTLYNTDLCREHKYGGSHDTFLFRLKRPLTEDFLRNFEFTPGSLGMENVLMWAFETKLKYCILNPCRILETFHLHCSELRSPRKWVSSGKKNGRSPFTKKLTCNN